MNLKGLLMSEHSASPAAAEYALRNGRVKLNGHIVTDGSLPADERDRVEVDLDGIAESSGFWEIRMKDEEYNFVESGDTAVFVGVPSEGQMRYCRSKGADVFAVSPEAFAGFRQISENPLKVSSDEIFEKTRSKSALLVLDLKVDIIKTMQALQGIVSISKPGGFVMVLMPNKERENDDMVAMSERFFSDLGIEMVRTFESDSGVTILGRKV